MRMEYPQERLSDDYVSVTEAAVRLQFTVYSKEEWEQFFYTYIGINEEGPFPKAVSPDR